MCALKCVLDNNRYINNNEMEKVVMHYLSKMTYCKECMQRAQRQFLLADKTWATFPYVFINNAGRLILPGIFKGRTISNF